MDDIRRYAKTPRAWEALARPDVVGRQAHTLLLMANGRRSEQELALLLGNDVRDLLHRLQHELGANFEALALMLDLLDEIERLRTQLRCAR